jgi:hypothetical protein
MPWGPELSTVGGRLCCGGRWRKGLGCAAKKWAPSALPGFFLLMREGSPLEMAAEKVGPQRTSRFLLLREGSPLEMA